MTEIDKDSKWAVKVIWPDGQESYVRKGLTNEIAVFQSKQKAKKQAEFMEMGMSDEVQSINVVRYRQEVRRG